ncbi:MAG: hypothetical protein ACFFGP_10260, partial [Promethearchaeota archaeon]
MKYHRRLANGGHIFGFIIATLFIIWSIFAFMDMFWNFGTDYVGFIWLGFGLLIIFGQIGDMLKRNKINHKIRNLVLEQFQGDPNVTLEEIANTTWLSWKSVRNIVLYLRAKGYLSIIPNGDLLNVNPVQNVPIMTVSSATTHTKTTVDSPSELPKYCPDCGARVERGT